MDQSVKNKMPFINIRWSAGICLLSVSALLFAGCSKSTAPTPTAGAKEEEKHDPVTIQVGIKSSGYFSEDEFNRYIAEPVKKKYPWITAERVIYGNDTLESIVVSGATPDLIITNNINGFPQLAQLDLLDSIEPLIQKHGIDLSRFEAGAVEAVKAGSRRSDLTALPYYRNFAVLYYSKEIFDKFAVPYPKDGMTWPQATELARKLTKLDNGVQYRGLEPNVTERLGAQLSLPLVDGKTNRTLINSEQWRKVMNQMVSIYEIPGNGAISPKSKGTNQFVKERILAMTPDGNLLKSLSETPDFWDMVTIPVWPEAPKIGMSPDEHIMVVSKVSKHKDDAMRVISSLLSDEVQMDMSKNGRTSVMKDPKIQGAFAQDLEYMKGKNIQAVFKTQMAIYDATLYDTEAINGLAIALNNVVTKGKDVNTALREAEESVNKKIETMLLK